jgi:hypothetical protein
MIAIYQVPPDIVNPIAKVIAGWQVGRWTAEFVNWALK